uniref:Ig-like domain-containing protein n=1 Tax=Esox lucius TaxID=8010 RepID=A0A3P9AK46_ESOLU
TVLYKYNITTAAQSSAMRLVSANIGDTVTLQCFRDNLGLNFMWYKQTLGDKPKILSNFYAYKENPAFHNEFKKNSRFSVLCGQGMYHLNISDTQLSDSASYYCGRSHINDFNFLDGAILISKNTGFVRQPESKSVQPGDSVTLNCTINTGTCEGEHSVYWFRLDSGESHPGIIYTNGDRSGQCMKSPESGSPTQSCVYNLPKRNLSLSDTGTYYCAVASCGEILFGNGTKLDVQGHDYPFDLSPTVLVLILSNIFLTMVTVLLLWMLCNTRRGDHRGICNHNSDVLNYAAVRFNPKKSSSARRVKDKTVRRDAVYSEVRYLQQE